MQTVEWYELAGFDGCVLKGHYESTAGRALSAGRGRRVRVYGGVVLNHPAGGLNPSAVDAALSLGARVVWMPTLESEHGVRSSGSPGRPFVPVSRTGVLLPEVKEVIGVIARNHLVLATGHSSAEEDLLLVREGRAQGAEHIIVTHAMSRPIQMSVSQMQEAARLGAFIEIVYVHSLTIPELRRTAVYSAADVAAVIRQVGAASIILSTDMGQVGIPLPPDGLAAFARALGAEGISTHDLDRMMKENPARLLGLPVS